MAGPNPAGSTADEPCTVIGDQAKRDNGSDIHLSVVPLASNDTRLYADKATDAYPCGLSVPQRPLYLLTRDLLLTG